MIAPAYAALAQKYPEICCVEAVESEVEVQEFGVSAFPTFHFYVKVS